MGSIDSDGATWAKRHDECSLLQIPIRVRFNFEACGAPQLSGGCSTRAESFMPEIQRVAQASLALEEAAADAEVAQAQ